MCTGEPLHRFEYLELVFRKFKKNTYIREAAKEKVFISGPNTKTGGGGKGPTTKEKKNSKKNIYIF